MSNLESSELKVNSELKRHIMNTLEKDHDMSFAHLTFWANNNLKRGECDWGLPLEHKCLIAWISKYKEIVDTVSELVNEKKIMLKPCHIMLYAIDGMILQLPVAKRYQDYKTDHRLPVLLLKYDAGRVKNEI